MGGKDSKLSYISQEEVLRRVTDVELKRLKDAFKRVSPISGFMTENVFMKEVLWDGVPPKIAQLIFNSFGGTTKGLLFRDLLAGMVVLTKGTKEEKIRMIFRMYADDTFSYIQKDAMDKIIVVTEEQIPPALSELFAESDQVNYEQFRNWVYLHPDSTTVTKWLLMEPIAFSLSSDTDTPTFYQTLAGVTHLAETDISELEKKYWNLKGLSKTGKFDLDTFTSLVSPPMPDSLCESIFAAFDENCDNHIDFKEIACGVSACCRGPILERQKFCFKIFDTNHDGRLSYKELQEMVDVLVAIMMDNHSHNELENELYLKRDPAIAAREILAVFDTDQDDCITMPEYLVWTVNNKLSEVFLDLLSQICHVVLGLRPQTPEEEGKIITDWLNREERKMKKVGQTWYLISIQWWNTWSNYVSNKPAEGPDGMVEGHSLYSSDDVHRHSQTKCKSSSICLPWDDGNVIMVNLNKANSVCETPLVGDLKLVPNHYSSHTFPRTSISETSSPRKLRLLQESEQKTRSPGISPKFKRNIEKPPKPGHIDNSSLIIPNPYKVMTLTNEGGRLKRDVMMVEGKDFKLVPEPVWKTLCTWYGGMPALPRNVVPMCKGDVSPEVELYPLMVKLLRHQAPHQWPVQTTTFSSMMTGIGGMAINTVSSLANNHHQQPKRYLAYTACFSKCHLIQQVYEFLCNKLRFTREDMQLWKISSKDENAMTLLDDDNQTVEQTGIEEGQQLLIEVRNKDLTWPEEMSQLAKNKMMKKEQVPTEPGATGLNNLGNTCFMNAAVQCVSNTRPLTEYFTSGYHLYEINRTNPLGMKGHIAQRYGDLVKDMWSGTTKTTAPLRLRWTIGKYAPRFNGFQQHDSQELLSFLLDGLHEDLNRVQDKPYIELKDSNGRPDEIVAHEAWDNHLLRNQSVIVDLFHGQLKSRVRCKECGNVSVRFDPFNYLSLPLPMESCIHLEITVMKLDGSVPVKYGLRLNMNDKYKLLKKELSSLANIPPEQILLVEIMGPVVKTLPHDNQKVQDFIAGTLYAYELPPVEDIEPVTVEEETTERKASLGLSEIQRGISAKKLASNGHILRLQNTVTDIDRNGTGSMPSSPLHSCRNSSTSLNTSINGNFGSDLQKAVRDIFNGFVIAVHRKMMLMDLYFLSSQKTRPSLFGTPIILPCDEKSTNQYLYEFIWKQVARIVSPLPPSESQSSNHAQDCDDSLCYEYPFTLKVVQKDGITCARCPWYRFCRGCSIKCNTEKFNFSSSFIAVDWEPTALHLRYQTTCERFFEGHASVADSRRKQTEPIDLDTCLQAFVKEEELDEDELYCCSKCKKHCLASKKLDIWRLPPILIVNLKRFQFLNGKWVKSHKIVNFPLVDFDPSCYLAPRKHSLCNCGNHGDQIIIDHNGNGPTVPSGRDSHSMNNCDKTNPESVSPSRRKVGENLNIKHSSAVKHEHDTESGHVNAAEHEHDTELEHVSNRGCEHDADIENSIVICSEHNADSMQNSENGYKHDADIEDAAVKGYKHDADVKDGAVKENECDVDLKAAGVNGYKHDADTEQASVNGYEHEANIHHASGNGYNHNADIELTSVHEFSHYADNSSPTGNEYNAENANYSNNQCSNNNRRTMCCPCNCIMSNSCHSNNNTTCKQLESKQPKYDLFAMSCHTGILGGGHYVAFAKNPNNKWYCYNDSSCKEVQEKQLDTNAAYILFYQRQNFNYSSYMPDFRDKVPDTQEIDDEFESDFKKLCVVQ